jgi:proteasome assembly chaperone (PAC2) family protein
MDELIWKPDTDLVLDRPLLVVAFRGLFDACGSATAAVEWLSGRYDQNEVGEIDPETFFDFTQERPLVSFDEDGIRQLTWPRNPLVAIHTPEGQRDLITLAGIEPHLRWSTFSRVLAEASHRSGAKSVVTLGSMVGMAPHSRPLVVTGSSTNPELANRLGLDPPSYQGPTGVVGILHNTLDQIGIPVISLRVSVPHYVPDAPNPKATRALRRRFGQVTGIETAHEELDKPAADWQSQVDAAVASDEEIGEYVAQLEAALDENEEMLPSGDDLAAEYEAFLRDQSPPNEQN